jgi:hypothetical protein
MKSESYFDDLEPSPASTSKIKTCGTLIKLSSLNNDIFFGLIGIPADNYWIFHV